MSASLLAKTNPVAKTENDIGFDAGYFSVSSCTVNPAIGAGTAADKEVNHSSLGVGLEQVGIGSALNTNLIPDGTLYGCTMSIAAGTPAGAYPLTNTASAADPTNAPIAGAGGAVTQIVVSSCTGDCDGSGRVSIGELQRVALLQVQRRFPCNVSTPANSCPTADVNNDGRVSIGELQQAALRQVTRTCP